MRWNAQKVEKYKNYKINILYKETIIHTLN